MPPVAVLALLAVPVLEVWVAVQVGRAIGAWPTVLLLLGGGLLGAALLRRQGRRAWRALQEALASGRAPGAELLDAALVLVGGALLLLPGFVSDVVGLLVMLPPGRVAARRLLLRLVLRRVVPGTRRPGAGEVISGEVVDGPTPDRGAPPRREPPRSGPTSGGPPHGEGPPRPGG